jgi:putative tryptophan/tyrosine transport system substrate-binding protein
LANVDLCAECSISIPRGLEIGAALMLTVLSGKAISAQDKYTSQVPNGLAKIEWTAKRNPETSYLVLILDTLKSLAFKRERRTYGSGRGACDETHVPTATLRRAFCGAFCCTCSRPLVALGVFRCGAQNFDATRGYPERIQTLAKELVSLKPNVILAHGTPVTRALHRETRTIPIVFVTVGDPVGDGFVTNLSRPGGNITGFIFLEAEVGGKWLELLTEMAPDIKVAAAMFNPDTAPRRGTYYLPSFEAAAKTHNVEPITLPVLSIADIENGIALLGDGRAGGLVATGDPFLLIDRKATIALAAQRKVPAVYFHAVFVRDGGLIFYGPDNGDIFRRAAPYVDRILRGANPGELPVQIPTKYEMVVNLKTAKALGLDVPFRFQQLADEVIE